MRNNYIVSISLLATLSACDPVAEKSAQGTKELVVDSSITSLTAAVNARVIATIPAIRAQQGTHIYAAAVNGVVTYDTRRQTSIASRVGGRVERLLIKYNYQPVRKGQLIMEIYSPDLAAAQQELLYVARNGKEMLAAARQRLQLLGMSAAQIDQVLRTGKVLYRVPVYSNSDGYILEKTAAVAASPSAAPAAAPAGDGMSGMGGGSTAAPSPAAAPTASPVLLREGQYVNAGQSLFTIYQSGNLVAEFAFPPQPAATVREGMSLLFYPSTNKSALKSGRIGLVEPVIRNGENFTLARVYLNEKQFRAGQLLTADMPVLYREGWWLPKKAVWGLGNDAVVFRKEHDAYVPVSVRTGAVTGQMVQVLTDISSWDIASNAAYLIDSESFIKTTQKAQE